MTNRRPQTVPVIKVRDTELLASDTRETYRQKIARITLDSVVQLVGLLDASGTVLEINRPALDAGGIHFSDVEGKPFWTTFWWQVSGEIQDALRDSIGRAARGESVRWSAEIYKHADGKRTIAVDTSLTPIQDEQGNVVFIAAEARESSGLREIFRILDRAPVGVCVLDSDFRIQEINPMALRVFGNTGTIIGETFHRLADFLWPKECPELLHRLRSTLETGTPFSGSEYLKCDPDGTGAAYYEWRLHRIPLHQPADFGIVCYFQEVSEQVRARQEAARAEERFRMMANQEALEGERRFGAFVTATSDVVYCMSADWAEMRYLNGRNFIPDTEDSKSWIDKYIPADDRPLVLAAIQRAIAARSVFELEHRVIRRDGTIGWTFSRAIPMLNEQGDLVEWFGTARDITLRKRSEEAFAHLSVHSEQQRRLYQTILANTPDLVYVFDLDHRFTYANNALLTMWGKSAEEAIGKNCLELGYEPWHAAMHDREIEQVIATKQPVRGDVPFSGTNGRRIYDYIFVPVLGVNGEVEAVAGTTRDVTDRKQAEDRSRQSEERFRFMAESMPQKIFTATSDGEIDYFNQQWEEFAGPMRGFGWMALIHPDDAIETSRLWKHSVDSGEPFQVTHRLRRSDGEYRWHLSRARAMQTGDGQITMWIGSSTEIHEQKAIEEALRHANQDLEQFAYAATHDLQEPLRSVKIYGELLMRRYGDKLDRQALEFLDFMRGGANRMEILVRDLLSYTQAGKADTKVESVEANACLEAALMNLTSAIAESNAIVLSDPLPPIKIHSLHLQQIFQNLIGNAIKYRRADAAPFVKISASFENDFWRFTVADNGIGIEEQYKDRIFGLFKRLHTSDKYSGTGIGLALCQRIVERNHGRIWVESEPGRGSQFHFTLPV